jgi:aspartate/methionine/tyrosine aminotransferase
MVKTKKLKVQTERQICETGHRKKDYLCPEAIKLAGAVPKIIQTDKINSYKITPQHLEDAITPKTAMLIINSPNNPGGFYCFTDVSSHYGRTINGAKISGSMDFAKALLEQANVAVVPGPVLSVHIVL